MTKSYPWLQNILVCGITILASTPALSQITPDNTLGAENSRLTPNVTINGALADRIDGGATLGSNLFHSFTEFNINDGQRVYFGNPTGIQNILTRVTGGNASSILGTLGVDGGANLFLLNPNGIIFGQNASLDLRGSFVGTTANAIGFGEQGFFSATNPNSPPLLTVQPSALLYTQLNGGSIVSQSIAPAGTSPTGRNLFGLRVPDGQSLQLVGGDVEIDGGGIGAGLIAQGGRIELGGLAQTGAIALDNGQLTYPDNLAPSNVSLVNGARVSVRGNGGGDVVVNANDFTATNGGRLVAGTEGIGNAGDITVNASTVNFVGVGSDGGGSGLFNQVLENATGNGGNIAVNTNSLNASSGAQIDASTFGIGDAGSVFVQALDSVSAAGNSYISSSVDSGAKGKGGNINLTIGSLSLTDGAQIYASTYGIGDAGNVFVQALDFVSVANSGILNNVERGAKGKGGNINLTAGSLSLTDRAVLDARTLGIGDTGSVFVQALDFVSVAGNSAIGSNVKSGAKGNGGNLNINAATLSLTDGGQLGTIVSGVSQSQPAGEGIAGNVFVDVSGDVTISGGKNEIRSGIFSYLGEEAKGKGGNINLTAGSLFLSDGVRITASTSGIGDAGSVSVQAKDSLSITGNSGIRSNVESGAKGNGGNLNITAATLSLTDGGQLGTIVGGASQSQPAGEGIAGNVFVDVSGNVTISGVNRFSSGIFSYLGEEAKGKGGNINLTTGSLFLTDGAYLEASTRGTGDAGSVSVQAKDFLSVTGNSGIRSNVESGAKGNGENLNITAATLSLTDGGQLETIVSGASQSQPAGEGIAGNVFVDVSGDVTISGVKNGFPSGILSFLEGGAKGKGGNINLTTGSLSLTDGAGISASTRGIGDAGNVLVQALDSVSVANNSGIFSSVESGAKGNGGNINITAATLSLTDGAQLGTIVSEASQSLPAGEGIAGNINVNVSGNVTISRLKNDVSTTIISFLGRGAKGKGGNINLTTGSLSLTDGAQVDASTFGEGDAGNIQINATDRVTVSGTSSSSGYSSALFTDTIPDATGIGGDITVNTNVLRVSDGAVLNAGTQNNSNGGNITVNARQVEAINGGQFLTSTNGSGNAGKITINATERVIVNGSDPTFDDRVAKFNYRVANSEAASGFFVRSEGSGIAGDIEVTSPQIRLDNGGKLNAESASGNGGNINIINSDVLLLRRNSTISTNAGLAQGAGNGGNITINAKTIAAVPKENSNITANAYKGSGGQVTITTDGLFGIAPADDDTLFSSDITASSELGVQGQIDITEPNVQPTQGLVELPASVLDASDQIAQTCPSGANANRPLGEFVVTGRGGSLPPNPIEPFAGSTSLSPLASIDGETQTNISPQTSSTPVSTATPNTIVEAQGWIKTHDGKIALVASAPSATPSASTTQATCPLSR